MPQTAAFWILTAALWFVLCRHLSGEWSNNEQYNYGWFVPFFAAYLFWLRWENRPSVAESNGNRNLSLLAWVGVFATLVLLLPLRLFEIAAPNWRPLGWVHACVVITLSCFALWCIGGKNWLRHFFFPVVFFLVSVPWLIWFEGGTTNHLMQIVANVAAETVALFGIPAQVEGSVIRLSTGIVGVSEACSGVRSLQTSLMIGLLFGELKRFDLFQRFLLLAAAAAVAMIANVCRTVFLVYIASRSGIEAVEKWHDLAGYSIVGAVFIGTILVSSALESLGNPSIAKRPQSPPSAHTPIGRATPRLLPLSLSCAIVAWLLLVEVGCEAWYRFHESAAVQRIRWSVLWPESAPKFRDIPTEQFRRTLVYNEGRGAVWESESETTTQNVPGASASLTHAEPAISYLLYFFRWEPGRGSVLHARGHQPDQCLPNAGWKQTRDNGTRQYHAGELSLPVHHFEFARRPPDPSHLQFAHAFYCVRSDTVRPQPETGSEAEPLVGSRDHETRLDFVRAVREGERNRGQQVMEFIIVCSREISMVEAETRFGEFFRGHVAALPPPPMLPRSFR